MAFCAKDIQPTPTTATLFPFWMCSDQFPFDSRRRHDVGCCDWRRVEVWRVMSKSRPAPDLVARGRSVL